MKTKCPICRGAKKMMKLGYVEGDCSGCDGKGYVIIKPIEELKADALADKKPEEKIHTMESIKNDEKKKPKG